MRNKRAKEIKRKVMTAMYDEKDIQHSKRAILKDKRFKSTYRAAKKNYTRTPV